MQRLLDQGIEPGLPEVALQYLIDFFLDAGPEMHGGMAPAPLTHGELWAWQQNTGNDLEPWETTMLRRLSAEWITMKDRAESRDCPAPYRVSLPSRAEVARKIDELL